MPVNKRGRLMVAVPVLQALSELRYADAAQVVSHLGGTVTLERARKALSNAITRGMVCNSGPERTKGVKGGSVLSTYWLANDDPPPDYVRRIERESENLFKPNRKERPRGPRYASVFHYAQGSAV